MAEDAGRTFRAGSASAAAHAEAASSINDSLNPGGKPVPVGPVVGIDAPADDPTDTSADDALAAKDAEADGGDAPPAPTDEPEVSDDEDPEATALAADDEDAASSESRTDSTRKTWDALQTDADRRRAFDEAQAEIERLKAAPPAEARKPAATEEKVSKVAEAPREEDIREVAQRLIKEDPRIGRFYADLTQAKKGFEQHAKTHEDLTKQGADVAAQIVKVQAVVEHYEALLKADPENFKAAEAVSTGNIQLLKLSTQATDLALRAEQAKNTGNALRAEYLGGLGELQRFAEDDIRSRQEREQTKAADTKAVEASVATWEQATPKALAHHKIPKENAADFKRRLLEKAFVHTSTVGDIPDLAAWMLGPAGQSIAKQVMAEVRAEKGAYVDAKKTDIKRLQPGPKGQDAIAKPDPQSSEARDGNRRQSDIEHRRASERLGRELQGAARR